MYICLGNQQDHLVYIIFNCYGGVNFCYLVHLYLCVFLHFVDNAIYVSESVQVKIAHPILDSKSNKSLRPFFQTFSCMDVTDLWLPLSAFLDDLNVNEDHHWSCSNQERKLLMAKLIRYTTTRSLNLQYQVADPSPTMISYLLSAVHFFWTEKILKK